MTTTVVHILALNGGNISSIVNAFEKLGVKCKEVQSKSDLESATHLIIPGIGHYDRAMKHLQEQDLIATLKSVIQDKQVPTLGICLGMHLLAEKSEEGKLPGLAVFEAEIEELKVENTLQYKVPHNGWNTLLIIQDCPLLKNIGSEDEFFFLHKYAWNSKKTSDIIAETEYENSFPVVIGSGNCWGVQFHPEKSHDSGLRILKNFIQL